MRLALSGFALRANGVAFVVPTLAANPAARVGHPPLLFGRRRQEQGCATRRVGDDPVSGVGQGQPLADGSVFEHGCEVEGLHALALLEGWADLGWMSMI